VGLGKIDLAIINVEKSGLGMGVRGSFVPQISVQKGKEKVGLEDNFIWRNGSVEWDVIFVWSVQD
jgi:hypothetical protein